MPLQVFMSMSRHSAFSHGSEGRGLSNIIILEEIIIILVEIINS